MDPRLITVNRVLTATEHETLTTRLETLLQHVDLLTEDDPVRQWTVVAEIDTSPRSRPFLRRTRSAACTKRPAKTSSESRRRLTR
jgi:hypothetical protein